MRETVGEAEVALLRRYEPILRFSRGEQFYPMDAEEYIRNSQLCVLRPNELPDTIVPRGALTGAQLGRLRYDSPGAIYYLHFVDPLAPAEVQHFRATSTLRDFHAGQSRLARVGLLTRLGDLIFSISLLLRGKVPGGQAAAAALRYQAIMAERPRYCYYGRVVRAQGYIVLQYWLFYAYNDWRSSFHGVNDHEADWEMVSVFLAEDGTGRQQPQWLAFSAHNFVGDDIRRRWDDPEIEKVGDHPLVYVAAGSHASYFFRGEYLPAVEVPLPVGLVRAWRGVLRFWRETLRQGDQPSSRERRDVLRIPFVDYARGDGIEVGPGRAHIWELRLLQNSPLGSAPEWADGYSGLWGLYTGDQLAGEDAPGGPRYNSRGAIRMTWNDPLGWCGLDLVPAPLQRMAVLERHVAQLHKQRAELGLQIDGLVAQVAGLGMELQAIGSLAPGRPRAAEVRRTLAVEADRLSDLKEQRALLDLAIRRCESYAARVAQNEQPPVRAHLNFPQLPASPAEIRLSRAADAWSAISIGALLIGFVLLAQFGQFWVPGAGLLVAVFAFLEALFHRRAAEFLRTVVVTLALVAALVLLVNNMRTVLVGVALVAGILVIVDNIRELRS
jgi:hypothetical protein